MRSTRTRNEQLSPYTGTYQLLYGSTVISTSSRPSQPPYKKTMTDSSGLPYIPSFMYNYEYRPPIMLYNGTYNGGLFKDRFVDVPLAVPSDSAVLNCLSVPKWDLWKSMALRNSNPNTPVVDLPLFLFELHELPSLISSTWRTYRRVSENFDPGPEFAIAYSRLRDGLSLSQAQRDTLRTSEYFRSTDQALSAAGEANLAYWFGWRPMVDDLLTLFSFQDAIHKRIEELRAFAKGYRVNKRLLTRGTSTRLSSGGYVVAGKWLHVTSNFDVEAQEEIWYCMDVRLKTDLSKFSQQEFYSLAKRLVLGLQVNLETAWNAVPFSWLADWFGNFSEVLSETRNLVDFEREWLNIMFHSYGAIKAHAKLLTTIAGPTEGQGTFDRKYRQVWQKPQTSLSLQLPLVDAFRVGILSSLFAVRAGSKPAWLRTG